MIHTLATDAPLWTIALLTVPAWSLLVLTVLAKLESK